MNNFNYIDLSSVIVADSPFPHFYSTSTFKNNLELQIFDWFENTKEWNLVQTDFYKQYEFNFLNIELPNNLQFMVNEKMISIIEDKFKTNLNTKSLDLVGITAHKLIDGQKIGIHNDFINGDETHRLVIHINPSWREENGGFLILFSSQKVEDISKVIHPINNMAFGFEISNKSNHAVSKINDFSRYTIIYTFKES